MKINHETTTTFKFTDLDKDIGHQFEKGNRSAVIRRATISYTVFDEPDEEGNSHYLDWRFHGYLCKGNGQIDKRQKRAQMVYFHRPVETWLYLLELITMIDSLDHIPMLIRQEVEKNLERCREQEKKQLERLLGD